MLVGTSFNVYGMAMARVSQAYHTFAMAKVWQEYGNLSLPYPCHGKGIARVWQPEPTILLPWQRYGKRMAGKGMT